MGIFNKLFGDKKKQQKLNRTKNTAAPRERSKPDFPVGENHVDDPDIKTFEDLGKWYPLPPNFRYKVSEDGSPFIERQTDKVAFTFLIEASMLTFNESERRSDGKVIYNTTEVIKTRR